MGRGLYQHRAVDRRPDRFGASNVGKSTLANRLGERLAWPVQSTDKMGRHPGRPWPEVREPVAEHYTQLSDETIYWFLKVHQDNIWPYVRQLLADASTMASGTVFEGCALRPEFLTTLAIPDVISLGLEASDEFLRARILTGSDYANQDAARKLLIDKFITRELRQNADFRETAKQFGLRMLNAADENDLSQCTDRLVADLGGR